MGKWEASFADNRLNSVEGNSINTQALIKGHYKRYHSNHHHLASAHNTVHFMKQELAKDIID